MGKAIQDLRKEHESILNVLNIADKVISSRSDEVKKLQFGKELVYFLKIFADKCHHGKEENYLFNELESRGIPNEGGPIGVMLKEHQEGRELIALMNKAVETSSLEDFELSIANYSELLRNHIVKENNVLFEMADKILDEEKQFELFEKFEKHEESIIGHGVHEELHGMIHKWSEEF